MKKVMMLLLLCGIAQVQAAMTVKNNSDTTVKVTINGVNVGVLGYVLRPNETTPALTLKPSQMVNYVKVDKFYDSGTQWSCGESGNIDDGDGNGVQRITIECVGDRRGSVIKPGQLGIVRRNSDNVFNNNTVVTFSGSKATGYTLKSNTFRNRR